MVEKINLDFTDNIFVNDPYPLFTQFRNTSPINLIKGDTYYIFDYESTADLLKKNDVGFPKVDLSSQKTWPQLFNENDAKSMFQQYAKSESFLSNWINLSNAENHIRLKKLFLKSFRKSAVDELKFEMERICDEVINEFKHQKEIDLIEGFCVPFSVKVILYILGLDKSSSANIVDLANGLFSSIKVSPNTKDKKDRMNYTLLCAKYFNEVLANPALLSNDGLLSFLRTKISEGEISEDEFIANAAFLIIAGQITTQNLMGNGIYLLMKYNLWSNLSNNNFDLLSRAIQEILRFESPAPYTNKVVLNDFNYKGFDFKTGQKIFFILASANRDEQQFIDADKFDVYRSPNDHLAFSAGRNYCIGSFLAISEIDMALRKLCIAFPSMKMADKNANWNTEGNTGRGLKNLKVYLYE